VLSRKQMSVAIVTLLLIVVVLFVQYGHCARRKHVCSHDAVLQQATHRGMRAEDLQTLPSALDEGEGLDDRKRQSSSFQPIRIYVDKTFFTSHANLVCVFDFFSCYSLRFESKNG
jgi:hypothetical protein